MYIYLFCCFLLHKQLVTSLFCILLIKMQNDTNIGCLQKTYGTKKKQEQNTFQFKFYVCSPTFEQVFFEGFHP